MTAENRQQTTEDANRLRVLITFALDDELVERIRAVDAVRVVVEILAPEQRQMLRGKYPSESERAAVAEGLHGAFEHADVVFGFWGAELHSALTYATTKSTVAGKLTLRDAAPNLKWIQLTSAGADRLLNSGFIEEGVTVTTVSGLHATPIGEFVLSSMLMFAKGAPQYVRAQARHEWVRFAPHELYGKTVGVVGFGHIGEEVGRLAKAFGCRVIATKRSATERHSAPNTDEVMPAGELHLLLAQSDYVVLSMPLTTETRGMIGEAELRAMKPSAVLVNIARGPVVVEAALIEALREKRIAGAALDVFDKEPLPADSPLWDMENVLVSPHISGGTEIYNQRAVDIFVRNLRRYLAGEALENVVDPARGY
ncbi:MAG: D-2-hydroxyacid dehydrogenase [Chloroflexi bacterium]|nr:D-2-hydroxyacid dehydrogenase [Chloroflexota bacterium]